MSLTSDGLAFLGFESFSFSGRGGSGAISRRTSSLEGLEASELATGVAGTASLGVGEVELAPVTVVPLDASAGTGCGRHMKRALTRGLVSLRLLSLKRTLNPFLVTMGFAVVLDMVIKLLVSAYSEGLGFSYND